MISCLALLVAALAAPPGGALSEAAASATRTLERCAAQGCPDDDAAAAAYTVALDAWVHDFRVDAEHAAIVAQLDPARFALLPEPVRDGAGTPPAWLHAEPEGPPPTHHTPQPEVAPPPLPADGVVPLDRLDGSTPDEALAPLAHLVEGADVIGLGVSVGCSGGQLAAQARVIRWLVEHHAVRVVVVPRAGAGADADAGLHYSFYDRELVDLLAWVRAFNRAHATDPVVVSGYAPRGDAEPLLDVLGEAPTRRTVLLGFDADLGGDLRAQLGDRYRALAAGSHHIDTLCFGTLRDRMPRSVRPLVERHLNTPAALVSLPEASWLRGVDPAAEWLSGFDGLVFVADARATQGGPWEQGPWFGAAAARYRSDRGGWFEHRTPGDSAEQERLWDRYEAWLREHGLEPVGRRKQMPWNRVKWQTFRSDDLAVELQIRRPAHDRGWDVYVQRRPGPSSPDAHLP